MLCYVYDAYCVCARFTAVDVGTDQTSYTVHEDIGQLEVLVSITSGQIPPGRECRILVVTNGVTARGELKLHFIFFTW